MERTGPCPWEQTPSSPPKPSPLAKGRPSREEMRRDSVAGQGPAVLPSPRAAPPASAPPRPPASPAPPRYSRLDPRPLPLPGPAPGSYQAGAADGCPCSAHRPAGLPRRPCLFTRRGGWDRAAPGRRGRVRAAPPPPRTGATAPSRGARGADSVPAQAAGPMGCGDPMLSFSPETSCSPARY